MLLALPLTIITALVGPWMMSSESTEIQIPFNDDAVKVKDPTYVDEKYCLIFPPTYCMGEEILDSNKSDLEIFREQFCPSKKMYMCVDRFAQRCMPTLEKYRDYMFSVMWQIVHNIQEKELCTKTPYRPEHNEYLDCIRFTKPVYDNLCPVINEDRFRKDLATKNYTFDNYMICVSQLVGAFCGQDTQSFLFEYLLDMNITYGYNPPKPNLGLKKSNILVRLI